MRVAVASGGFAVLGACDAMLRRPGLPLTAVARGLVLGVGQMLLLLLPLTLAAALAMLALTALTDALGVGHAAVSALVEWAVLYAPWALQYLLTQRACLRAPLPAVLPTKARPRPAAR